MTFGYFREIKIPFPICVHGPPKWILRTLDWVLSPNLPGNKDPEIQKELPRSHNSLLAKWDSILDPLICFSFFYASLLLFTELQDAFIDDSALWFSHSSISFVLHLILAIPYNSPSLRCFNFVWILLVCGCMLSFFPSLTYDGKFPNTFSLLLIKISCSYLCRGNLTES